MATPTPNRHQRGATPPNDRTPTFPVEPKSEFLRNAINARRAKDNPVLAMETRPTPKRATSSVTPSPDPWIDQAMSEEDTTRITPASRRGRRPSDSALPRMPTQREQQAEMDAMKNTVFNANLKLELLSTQNCELKDSLELSEQRIRELEPLEEEVHDLQDQNNRLQLKVQDLEEENNQLHDARLHLRNENAELRESNVEILKIQEETIANAEQHQSALDEAADMIVHLTQSNDDLKAENAKLQALVTSSQIRKTSSFGVQVDGLSGDRYPGRIQSIDESRPSTSHFDSDYYSQPDSPQSKAGSSREVNSYSERARNLQEINVQGKKSIQELKTRTSTASMRLLSRTSSPAPAVPKIPSAFHEPRGDVQTYKPTARTPSKHHKLVLPNLQTATPNSPVKPSAGTPRTPTAPKEGLRGLYRGNRTIERARPSSSSYQSPTSSKHSAHSDITSPHLPTTMAPPRMSSRNAHTSPGQTLRSSPSDDDETLVTEPEPEPTPSECSFLPPPTVDTEDLISEADPREKWWKDVYTVYPHSSDKLRALNSGLCTSSKAPLCAPRSEAVERDFFFNGAEDEEMFLRKALRFKKK